MPKGFIVITDNASRKQQDAIRELVKSMPWWHQTPQAWLLVDRSDTITPSHLREAIMRVCPTLSFLVFAARMGEPHEAWTGFAPPDWFEWFEKCWKESP